MVKECQGARNPGAIFAMWCLMEIPEQYEACKTLGLINKVKRARQAYCQQWGQRVPEWMYFPQHYQAV
jgi:hypothetical protein